MTRNPKRILADACRIILALTFVFSGFTKTIDPWGTAIKITEYLNSFGFETLNQYRFGFFDMALRGGAHDGLHVAFQGAHAAHIDFFARHDEFLHAFDVLHGGVGHCRGLRLLRRRGETYGVGDVLQEPRPVAAFVLRLVGCP
ncbi:MAG: hypothetical protein L6V35_03740 [Alistipes putredinis]|nr:MAG: hypothetical protein L6V35_03740 [Alistipes putredinis]